MENKILKLFIFLFIFHFQSFSFASEAQELNGKIQIIADFEKPKDPEDSGLPPGEDDFVRLRDGVDAKDGSRYMFVLRNNKIAYYKKSISDEKWGGETFVRLADGLPDAVFPDVYPEDLIDRFVYRFGEDKVLIVFHDSSNFTETRTLTVDLSNMTLIKNEVTVESTTHLYKEYRAQNAPVPAPGPQLPAGMEISRISTMKDSKLIYYYSRLERQENRRIVRKSYYRLSADGVWSQAYEAKNLPVPEDIAASYQHHETRLVYGRDVTKERIAVIGMHRKRGLPQELPPYVLLMYHETPAGEVSLRVVEKNLENFSPPIPEEIRGPMWQAFYNEKTSELSISAHTQSVSRDQFFSIYNMKEKKLVKTRTVTHPKGMGAVYMTNLLADGGESIGLLKGRRLGDKANFYFVKWSGSDEQKYYKISKGPPAKFGASWAPMLWSDDRTRIYTSDQSGTVCETNLTEGSLRCATPDLKEATCIERIRPRGGRLRLNQEGIIELMSSTSARYNSDKNHRIIYSFTANFNEPDSVDSCDVEG